MAIIGVAGTAVGAAATVGSQMYSANQQKKAQKAQMNALNGADVGSKPKPAMWVPVDFTQEQLNAIMANRDSLPFVRDLVNGTNRFITADAIRRADKLIPGYSASMRQMGMNANDLINARIPNDVMERIVSDRAGVNNGINIPGLGAAATGKDLGLTSLDMMNQGSSLLSRMVGMAEQVSPRSTYVSPKDSIISPSERIANVMNQHILDQQSRQSANFLEAGANPRDMAQLGLQLSQPASRGVDWAQVGGSVAQGLLSAYGKSQAGGLNSTGGYDSATGMYKAAPYAGGYSYTPDIGYVPRAQPVYAQNSGSYYSYGY